MKKKCKECGLDKIDEKDRHLKCIKCRTNILCPNCNKSMTRTSILCRNCRYPSPYIDKKTKICRLCKTPKLLKEYNKTTKYKDGFNRECRECSKNRWSNWYSNPENKKQHIKASAEYNKIRRDINREYVYQYFLEHHCVDCGEADPVVLEFHHLRDKQYTISNMLHKSTLNSIKQEIDKCEVRCSNCHKRKTAEEHKFYNWKRNNETIDK